MKKIMAITVIITALLTSSCISIKPSVYIGKNVDVKKLRIGIVSITGYNSMNAESEISLYLLKLGCEVFERNNIDKILKEQEIQLSGIIDESTAIAIGKMVGVNTIFIGSISAPIESKVANFKDNTWNTFSLTFSGRLISIEDGSIIASGKVNSSRGYPDRALSDAIELFFQELEL